jgi:hypothetical protein
MAKKNSPTKTKAAYSFSEYLEKFRPHPLPEGPRINPRSDDLVNEIINKALQKIRKSKGEQTTTHD